MIHTVWPGFRGAWSCFFLHVWFASYRVFWEKVPPSVARLGQVHTGQEITS